MARIAIAPIIMLVPLHFVQASDLIEKIEITSYIGNMETRTIIEGRLEGLTLYTTTEQGCDPTNDLYLCENQNSYILTGDEYEISDPYTTSVQPGYYTLVSPSEEKTIEISSKTSSYLQPTNRADIVLNDDVLYVKSSFVDTAYSSPSRSRYVSSTTNMQDWTDVEGWMSDFTGGGRDLFFALDSDIYSASLTNSSYPKGCNVKLYRLDNNEWLQFGEANNLSDACGITDSIVLNDIVFGVGKPGYSIPQNVGIWSSVDGLNWSKLGNIPEAIPNPRSDERFSRRLITHNGMLLFTGGVGDGTRKIWRSHDGVEWTLWGETPALENIEQASIQSADGKLIMLLPGSDDNMQLLISTDGVNWEGIELNTHIPTRFGATFTEYNGEYYIVGGWTGDDTAAYPVEVDYIWKSQNLTSWEPVSREPFIPGSHRSVVNYFDGKFFSYSSYFPNATTGFSGTWASSDGVDWYRESTSSISDTLMHTSFIEFDNKLFAFGTLSATTTGQAYSSGNGVDWVLENSELPFRFDSNGSMTIHNGSLWATSGSMIFEVWNSQDGVNWSLVYEEDSLVNATGYQLVSRDGRLWLVGGKSVFDGVEWDRIYYSYTGRYWYRSRSATAFPQRSRPTIFEYNGRLRSVGGSLGSGGGIATNIWESDDARNWEMVGSSNVGNRVFTYGDDIFLALEYINGDFKNRIRISNNGFDWTIPVKHVVSIENDVVSVNVINSSDTSVLDVFNLEAGENLTIDLSVYSNSDIDSVAGSCTGTLSGADYEILNVSESCEITVAFEQSVWWNW